MTVALHVYIKDKSTGGISVEHVFYGKTEAEADAKRLAHMAGCGNYAAADVDNRTTEFAEEIRDIELPNWDELIADEGDDEEEDEEDEEGEVIDVQTEDDED